MSLAGGLLYTQTAYPPSIGGAQEYLHQLARQMACRQRVEVAAFWSQHRTDWLLGTTLRAPGGPDYVIDGVPVHLLGFSRGQRWRLLPWVLAYYGWQGEAIRRIAGLLQAQLGQFLRRKAFQPALVHHGRVGREPLAFASLALARQLGVPFALTPYHHPRWGGRLYRHYHRLYRSADLLFALTAAERDTLAALGVDPERIVISGTGPVLSHAYDAAAFRRQHGLDGPLILFLGQKYPYKGFAALLRAAPLVWQAHPRAQFLFVGPRTRASRRLFAGIQDERIVELGAISLEEKTSALAACDLLCLPSTQESFGGVFIEAWCLGKPVIGADIPAVAQVISQGVDGFVGPPVPAFLAEKIDLLLSDPALRQRLGDAGRQKARTQFDWPVLAARTEAAYRAVIEKRRPGKSAGTTF